MSNVATIVSEQCDGIVRNTWKECSKAFAKNGRILTFPDGTDPRKTYHWRYAERLAKQLVEWGFDSDTSRMFIQQAVSYLRERRLLHKGLSAFFQSNILLICHQRLEKHHEKITKLKDSFKDAKRFLDDQSGGKSLVDVLLERDGLTIPCNIVVWYDDGKITTSYLAISKSCNAAAAKLSRIYPDQRSRLPSNAELLTTYIALQRDQSLCREAKLILGSDWRTL